MIHSNIRDQSRVEDHGMTNSIGKICFLQDLIKFLTYVSLIFIKSGKASPYLFHGVGWSMKLYYFDIVRSLVSNQIKKIKSYLFFLAEEMKKYEKKFKIKIFRLDP